MILRKAIYAALIYLTCANNAYAAGIDAVFFLALIPLFFIIIVMLAVLDASPDKSSSSKNYSSVSNEHLVVEDAVSEKEIKSQESLRNKNFRLSRRVMVLLIVTLHILFPFLLTIITPKTPSVFNFYYPVSIALFIFYSYAITNRIKSDALFSYVFSAATVTAFAIITVLSF